MKCRGGRQTIITIKLNDQFSWTELNTKKLCAQVIRFTHKTDCKQDTL